MAILNIRILGNTSSCNLARVKRNQCIPACYCAMKLRKKLCVFQGFGIDKAGKQKGDLICMVITAAWIEVIITNIKLQSTPSDQ